MNRIVYLSAIIIVLMLTGCRGAKLSVADEQMARGEYHDASKTYRKVYNKLTKKEQRGLRGEVAFKMGECHRKLNQSARASAAYQNAIRYGFPDSTAQLHLAEMLHAEGKYAQAIDNFNVLAQLDTADYYTFFFRGIAKYNLGDLRGARRDFDRSVQINPVFTSGYHYRGITESRFGNYDEALADLQKAIDLRPGFIGLYFSRGVTYFLSQQFEKAIADFDKYIRKEPKDPSAYLNRGASHLFLGDTLSAMNDYNKAIKLDRFDPEGYVRRGRLYASKKEYGSAF